jgi:lysophospholipase L1-like esterase
LRIVGAVCLAGLSVVASGCDMAGLGDSPTSPSGPPAAGSSLLYSAVGASDVIGYGSSKPCLPYSDCNGSGYVWVASRQLKTQGYNVEVKTLGIPGAVISRDFQTLGGQYGRNDLYANIIDQEVPFIVDTTTVVTIFAGGNDVNVITSALGRGAGAGNPTAFVDQWVETFRVNYSTLIAAIRARAKNARIIVLNLPNLAAMPYLAGESLAHRQAAQRASVNITKNAINPLPNVTVVDLMCDPRFYNPANISSDGFHPNDALYAIMGAEIANAIASASYPAPRSSCAQMTLY